MPLALNTSSLQTTSQWQPCLQAVREGVVSLELNLEARISGVQHFRLALYVQHKKFYNKHLKVFIVECGGKSKLERFTVAWAIAFSKSKKYMILRYFAVCTIFGCHCLNTRKLKQLYLDSPELLLNLTCNNLEMSLYRQIISLSRGFQFLRLKSAVVNKRNVQS